MQENNQNKRRAFLKTSIKGGIVLGVGISGLASSLASCSATKKVVQLSSIKADIIQQPLPYGFNALENVIDTNTMEIHYSKHAMTYASNLKDAIQAEAAGGKTLEELLGNISKYTPKMRNNGGGHYNHEMFWKCMRPKRTNNLPGTELMNAINSTFGSFDKMKTDFSEAAKTRFGSGWAWLYSDESKALKIGSSPNQDNPLMDVSPIKGFPLLGLDVWEHAYYLKYQNRRAEYVENWWSIVNWDYVAERWKSLI